MEKTGLEGKFFMIGTGSISQAEYDELAGHPDTKCLGDEDAKKLLYDLFAYPGEQIRICHSMPVYKTDRYGDLHKIHEYDRSPLYHSARRNYILFDCADESYEFKNGYLRRRDIDGMEIQERAAKEGCITSVQEEPDIGKLESENTVMRKALQSIVAYEVHKYIPEKFAKSPYATAYGVVREYAKFALDTISGQDPQ